MCPPSREFRPVRASVPSPGMQGPFSCGRCYSRLGHTRRIPRTVEGFTHPPGEATRTPQGLSALLAHGPSLGGCCYGRLGDTGADSHTQRDSSFTVRSEAACACESWSLSANARVVSVWRASRILGAGALSRSSSLYIPRVVRVCTGGLSGCTWVCIVRPPRGHQRAGVLPDVVGDVVVNDAYLRPVRVIVFQRDRCTVNLRGRRTRVDRYRRQCGLALGKDPLPFSLPR